MRESKWIIYVGDAAALALVTFIGFATHGETDFSFIPRFLAILVPLTIVWCLIALPLGLFQPENTSDLKQLWRIPLAILFAAPLAVAARSMILQTGVVPIFMLALGGVSALGMILWRGIYFLLKNKRADT